MTPRDARSAGVESSARLGRADYACLALTLVLALIRLPTPFMGDQGLYAVGGRTWVEGGVLYRDFWDLKQPGIFLFYGVAGRLFGFTELGVHAFELLYMMGLAVTVRVTAGPLVAGPVRAALPLATVGLYYAAVGDWHLTQVEALVAFPLYVCVLFASRAATSPRTALQSRRALAFSGAAAGVVALFKLACLPIPVAVWCVTLLRLRRGAPNGVLTPLAAASWIVVGLAVVAVPSIAYFASQAGLERLLWTHVLYPLEVSRELDIRSVGTLVAGVKWLLLHYGTALALAAVGVATARRRGWDLHATNLAVWCAAGFAVIGAQLWWAYHYNLVVVPLGVLAALGIDAGWERWSRGRAGWARAVVPAALLALFGTCLPDVARTTSLLARNDLALSRDGLHAFQAQTGRVYPTARDAVRFLEGPDAAPGPVYVFGNHLYVLLSGRAQAVGINGWPLEQWVPSIWREVEDELRRVRPPYVFVRTEAHDFQGEDFMAVRAPALTEFLAREYRELRRVPDVGAGLGGTWLVRRDLER